MQGREVSLLMRHPPRRRAALCTCHSAAVMALLILLVGFPCLNAGISFEGIVCQETLRCTRGESEDILQ